MKEMFGNYGVNITDKQIKMLLDYYEYMMEYNKNVNLTSITDEREVWVKHFLDSVLPINDIPKNAKLIDIGTGAGFPGVPLKIVRPDIQLTLVDSLSKRTKFLSLLCEKLGIQAEIIHSRAEDLSKANKNHRERYDVCVARAVSPLVTLAEYTLPFVKVGGVMLAYKAKGASAEVNSALFALTIMGGYFVCENIYTLPYDMGSRNILIIKKTEPTPVIYPRGGNLPKLKPIVK